MPALHLQTMTDKVALKNDTIRDKNSWGARRQDSLATLGHQVMAMIGWILFNSLKNFFIWQEGETL